MPYLLGATLERLDYLKSVNAEYIDDLYSSFIADPESVDPSWRYFFEGLDLGAESVPAALVAPEARLREAGIDLSAEAKVAELINAYREMGRLLADIDPLSPAPSEHPLLQLSRFGLSEADLSKTFTAGRLLGMGPALLRDILAALKETYCRTIGVEFTHIQSRAEREWLQQRMESSRNREVLDPETRKFILQRLTESESFERFLHTRYVAQKRFSVEGAEALIPTLDCMIETCAELGAEEFVLGMAHRGRLNVLVNIFGKKPEYIFTEFEGTYKTDVSAGEGDVKYHMGYSSDFTTRKGKKLHLSLASNPSHLEFVNPVIEGITRAKQAYLADRERTQVVPVTIHGDASFAGQGICYETLNLSQLAGYRTGGTLHIVINNQIGFTTFPRDSRSTSYATDLAKMLEVPIFHVNGDDPEALWYLAKLGAEYRQKFGKDFFIDQVCYRKHGHNEGDEPSFTQPLMYAQIKQHQSALELYRRRLVSEGVLSAEEAQAILDGVMARFMEAQALARKEAPHPPVPAFTNRWKGLHATSQQDSDPEMSKTVPTAVPRDRLLSLAEKLNGMPEGFHLHPKLNRFFEGRLRAVRDGLNIDWGNAEALAYATLLVEGDGVRLSGQDTERGTFTHRHAVLNDTVDGHRYVPHEHLAPEQGRFEVYNSHLSETAVMGFEYGYALAEPFTLVLWEAQFGDFANGAQVIIDQFIASGESKWNRSNGLVLLLPHGFEGQGPEHSSGRLERFLQLCGKNNMAVCNLTTPAQFFHLLRRQMKREFRKPLIVMTPKSLLRHPRAVSTIQDLSEGAFSEILDDAQFADSGADSVKTVLLCSGKIYYDLLLERAAAEKNDVAIIRMEQFYPWPGEKLLKILNRYSRARKVVWVQEEPRNMGGWSFVFNQWQGGYAKFGQNASKALSEIDYIGREVGAAPAVGSTKLHEQEQKAILSEALSK